MGGGRKGALRPCAAEKTHLWREEETQHAEDGAADQKPAPEAPLALSGGAANAGGRGGRRAKKKAK